MNPIGYIVQEYEVRLKPTGSGYDKRVNRMPQAYHMYLLNRKCGPFPDTPDHDEHWLCHGQTLP